MSQGNWQCDSCGNIGPLNIHGRCGVCGSNAVIDTAKLPEEVERAKAK